MTDATIDAPLLEHTDPSLARPLHPALTQGADEARQAVRAARDAAG